MKNRFFIPFITLMITFSLSNAQAILDNNAFANAKLSNKYPADIDGSPYLNDDWARGYVKLADGEKFKDLDLKYDEIANQLLFKNTTNGEPMQFTVAVIEFTINISGNDKHFRSGYDTFDKNQFYEVIADGNVQLLKQTRKKITEVKAYNAPSQKTIAAEESYFLDIGNKLMHISKNEKSLLGILSNKEAELKNYIKANNLNVKKDEDVAKLIKYYNSI